jgi:serine/threonine-protein kinase
MPLMIGSYALVKKLAEGGMGEVHLAVRSWSVGGEQIKRRFVVKMILPHLANAPDEGPNYVRRFLREASLVAQLYHSNIVQIVEFGEMKDNTYYLVLEYVDGPSLGELIRLAYKANSPIPFNFCARMISMACDGLHEAHELRDPETGQLLHLVHRDVSPGNLLMTRSGVLKVADFGIALTSKHERLTNGRNIGKLRYQAPERVRGDEPIDRRSDIYSLGVVLYQALTGKAPHEIPGEDEGEEVARKFEPIVPVRMRRADIPEALESIVERALARNPQHRYSSCLEMQLELEAFISSTGQFVVPNHLAEFIQTLRNQDGSISPAKESRTVSMRGKHVDDVNDSAASMQEPRTVNIRGEHGAGERKPSVGTRVTLDG